MKYGNIIMTKDINEANCVTHSGTFHADEVFATALISIILDEIKIIRVNEVDEKFEDKIIYDVGLGELDHHQKGGNGKRENDVPYAACGLVWKKYGKQILIKVGVDKNDLNYLFNQIDNNLIQFIDANDNGILPAIDTEYKFVNLATIIATFNPNWDEEIEADERFIKAVDVAKIIVENVFNSEISKLKAKENVEEAILRSNGGIMILDRFMPWKEFVINSTFKEAKHILFVVFPSKRGGYNVYAVPKENGSFENRKDLPRQWSGLRDEKLQEITGVKTARFCHPSCFICSASDKEDAIKLAKIAIEY